ncbi:type VII secretion protein EsaA [Bacillus halotolerans]|uniref:type VII secretion protein EsaA n=1 Tax=Bacillus halotolerans TaxID=260554 RepID=UPI002DB5814D|nr:type VII secretion protein EsaA [Bacillus halotolerans]MEC3640897.1 type VII secretion protein EsaA [Bacillus halotolerans]
MTEQRKNLIKLISAVIIILLLPVLFFRFIGEDPAKKAANSTRQIAVVNEDTGVLSDEVKADDEDDQSAQFGKEVAAVLGERPDYSWTVVNRSAAETGLKSKKYDAIVYIPSDFSKNILSYDKERPQKATLEFSIQDNLNAVNKEKVQRELEDAQKTMNKKMSALYWNFVSQKVDNIRGEFDKIVNKESEFQNVMYNFYKPSSNDLAGEIKRQKDLIDELKKSMNEAQGTTKEKASTAEEAKNTLKDFVDTVERYKEYQENQKKLLLAAQDSTQQQIQTGLDAISAQQKANQFSEQMSGLSTGISQVKTQLGIAGLAMNDAKKARQDQVPLQEVGMAKIQSDLINNYLTQYKAASKAAALGKIKDLMTIDRKPLTQSDENLDDEDLNDQEDEKIEDLDIDLVEQREELKRIAADIQDISDNLKEPEKEEPAPENPSPENPDHPDDGSNPNPDDTQGDTGNNDNSSDIGNDGQTDGNTQDQDQQQGTDGQEQNGDTSNGESESGQTETGTSAEQTASSDSALQFIQLANEGGSGDSGDIDGGMTQPEDEGQTENDEISDIAKAKEQLIKASERIKQIEEGLKGKQDAHNEKVTKLVDKLLEKIEKLDKKIVSLNKIVTARENDFKTIYRIITNTENNILKSPYLEYNQNIKNSLSDLFSLPITTKDVSQLMSYYNDLSLYEATLYDSLDQGSLSWVKKNVLNEQQDKVSSVLALSPEESASWEDLKNNTMQTDEDIDNFINGMTEFADNYGSYIRDSQAGVLDELTKISESASKASEQLVTGAAQESATFNNDGLSGTMALSVQDTVGQEVLQMSDVMGSLSERQSGIIDYTTNMQQSVNDVQTKADTLNNNWGKNVASTKLVRSDVYGILGNTLVDGQNNGYVYDYLANPLKISGQVPEEKIQTVPPVVILVIILISSLLIGYFSSYYQNAPLLVKGALFGILNILVGLMISLFGLNIYSLPDDQTIKWSVFTILLLVASSAFIRAAFRFGSIPGWVASAAMILFYVAPLIDLIMPNFTFEDPVSKVYIDIQYGTGHLFTMGISVLLIITLIAAALPLVIRLIAEKTAESDETYEA